MASNRPGRMYTKSDKDAEQLRQADVSSIDSADTFSNSDNVPHKSLLTGVVTRLRKKGAPTSKKG